MMKALQQKLQTELSPGSCVVSHVFKFPSWRPVMVQDNLFIYRVEVGETHDVLAKQYKKVS